MPIRIAFLCWALALVSSCGEPRPLSSTPVGDESSGETDSGALDLREANVTDISYDEQTGEFGVTLQHDDDNEDGYADWWQVETMGGQQLGRRTLTHRHDNHPFTRYVVIADLPNVDYVVIRGHDQDHGYGGQAIIYNLATGDKEKVVQGSEPVDFVDYIPQI